MSIPLRTLATLAPMTSTSRGIRVRLAADAFIPWSWVKFPDPPPVHPVVGAAGALLDFFVHGDGRLVATSSDTVGTKYRIRGVIEVDILQLPGEFAGTFAGIQPSRSELRGPGGGVIHSTTATGPLTSGFSANRVSPTSVNVGLTVSGSVPWNVAGPQPAIDLKYGLSLSYNSSSNIVSWTLIAEHDGFPGHEVFVESGGTVRHVTSYTPTFFNPVSTGTATPSIKQAFEGASALGGVVHKQTWTKSGTFTP